MSTCKGSCTFSSSCAHVHVQWHCFCHQSCEMAMLGLKQYRSRLALGSGSLEPMGCLMKLAG